MQIRQKIVDNSKKIASTNNNDAKENELKIEKQNDFNVRLEKPIINIVK